MPRSLASTGSKQMCLFFGPKAQMMQELEPGSAYTAKEQCLNAIACFAFPQARVFN